MKIKKSWRNTIAATAIAAAMACSGYVGFQTLRVASAADDRPAPSADNPNDRPQPPGQRRPGGPGGMQRAIDDLKLTDEQKQKIDPIVQAFRQKEQKAREEFLKDMKAALTPEQYESLEKSMKRPPGPPPREQANREPPRENRESAAQAPAAAAAPADKDPSHVPVTFIGGYETDPRDHGRPVVLVASVLGVTSDVFRDAFSHVKPAGPGHEPEPEQVRLNKQALMSALGKFGITNERLDTVSNFYRYSASRGQMWRSTPATAYATIRDGKVTAITITNPGAGYSSPPKVSVAGVGEFNAEVKLSFGTDFAMNGSIKEIAVKP